MGLFNLFGKKEKQGLKGYFSLQISNIEKLNSKAVRVEFDVPSSLETTFKFEPGQYVNIALTINGEEQRRSYSICSHPNDPISIAIKRVENGIVSNWFNDLTDFKEPILVSAPTGNFVLPQKAKSFVAIAAGSGITPMMSILKAKAQESDATLIYGNKTKDEAIFLEEIKKLPLKSATHFFSREKVEGMNEGRIDKNTFTSLIKENIEILKNDCFLICGPEEMILSCKETLNFFGLSDEKILFELFTTPLKAEEPKAEKFNGISDVTVMIDDDEASFELSGTGSSILDAVENEGLDAPYSCRGGVCSSCKAKVLEGSASMDLNYSLTDEEVKEGYILTCQAHPSSETIKISYDE
jgi:ring-1,2-phenylacetyl-CoA epoxidase subunit PaaE